MGTSDDLSGYIYIYNMIQPTKKGDVDGNTLNMIEPTTNALVVIQRDLMGTYPLVSSNMARRVIPELNRGL